MGKVDASCHFSFVLHMKMCQVNVEMFHFDLSQRMHVVEKVVVHEENTDEDYSDAFEMIYQSWWEIAC